MVDQSFSIKTTVQVTTFPKYFTFINKLLKKNHENSRVWKHFALIVIR